MKRVLNKKSILSFLLIIVAILLKNKVYIITSIILLLFNVLSYRKLLSYKDKKVIKYLNKINKIYTLLSLVIIIICMFFSYKNDNLFNSLLIGISLSNIVIPYNIKLKNISSFIKYEEYNFIIRSSILIVYLLLSVLALPDFINPNVVLLLELLIFFSGLTFKILDKENNSAIFENEIVTTIQSMMIASSEIFLFAYILGASENIPLAKTVLLTIFILANFFLVSIKIRKYNVIKNMVFMAKNNVYLLPLTLLSLIIIYIPFGNKLFGTNNLTVYSLLLCVLLAYVFVCWYDLVKLMRRKKK